MEALNKVFNSFNDLNILIIGDVMVDSYIWGSVSRISPEAPVPVLQIEKKEDRLGGAANVALNVQAMGATPLLCAIIGNDLEGEQFKKRLHIRDIDDSGIIISNSRPTTSKTRVISGHQHIVRIDSETEENISEKDKRKLLEIIDKLCSQADAIIFEDYDKGLIDEELIRKTLEIASVKNIPTIVDPKKKNFFNYSGVSLFKPNLKELLEGLNIEIDKKNLEEIKGAAIQLQQKMNGSDILLTLSELGILYLNSESSHHFDAHLREIADVSGAGDTVVSIAAMCKALSLPPEFISELSNLGGGLVCEHMGVVPIEKNILLKEAITNDLHQYL